MSSLPVPEGRTSVASHIGPYKIAALLVWGIGAFMTTNLLWQLGVEQTTASFFYAGLLQLILTLAESAIWQRRGATIIEWSALALDVFANFGGLWHFVVNIDKVGSWNALEAAFQTDLSPSTIGKGLLCLLAAVIVAGLPERLWIIRR